MGKRIKLRYLAYSDMRRSDRDERIRANDPIRRKARENQLIFQGEQREHAITRIKDAMSNWKSTPFENEASTRHGIRAVLCLKGYDWHRADREAASLVAEALLRLRARRPTWEEGQRQYAIPKEDCNWCGRPVPKELLFGFRSVYYCSTECARATMRYRERQVRSTFDKGYQAAQSIIERLKHPVTNCQNCKTRFRPEHAYRKFCSHPCSVEYNTRHSAKPCAQCGEPFKPKNEESKYCSYTCSAQAQSATIEKECVVCETKFTTVPSVIAKGKGKYCSPTCAAIDRMRNKRYERICECCGTPFVTAQIRGRFCSKTCSQLVYNEDRGTLPKRLKANVFDRYFDYLPLLDQSATLTAQRFDQLMAA